MNPFQDVEKIRVLESIRLFSQASGIRLFFSKSEELHIIVASCLSQVAAVNWMVHSFNEKEPDPAKKSESQEFYTSDELEQMLNRKGRTIRLMVSQGKIPKPIVPGRWNKETIDNWMLNK